ncbi:cell division protein FtsL [bacterium LRH843]|nr:cell division protein FtsL [bacterium LRH843]
MSMVARKIQVEEQYQVQPKKQQYQGRMKITLGEKVIASMLVFVAFIFLSVIVHNYASIYNTNKEMFQLEQEIGKQTNVNEGLSLQVVELSAPDRILHLASEELGMILDDNKVKVVQN